MNDEFDVSLQAARNRHQSIDLFTWSIRRKRQQMHSMGAETIILASFLLLALGEFLRHTASSLPIPYTVQLLICGGAFGFFLRDGSTSSWDGPLQHSLQALADMDPHLMLHVFLPPLIFESAASLEWHLFNREKWYIFALAGPG